MNNILLLFAAPIPLSMSGHGILPPSGQGGWISRNRLSPKSPVTISRAEANRIMEAQRKKIADASKDEHERICANYQRRGGLLTSLNEQVAVKANARMKRSAQSMMTTPSQPVRRSERNSGKSSTSSVKSSQPLIGNTPSPMNLNFESNDVEGSDATPLPVSKQHRLSNIMEEGENHLEGGDDGTQQSSPYQNLRSRSANSTTSSCCSQFLCKLTNRPSLGDVQYTECINCGERAHIECCEQFYVQTPSKLGPIPKTMLSVQGKKRLKAVPEEEKDNAMFCLMCKATMEHRRSTKRTKKKTSDSTDSRSGKGKSAPKKAPRKTNMLPSTIRQELRAAAGFYSRSLVFLQPPSKADECKSRIAKIYYGDPAKKQKSVIQMLVDGDSPFNELYSENETDDGVERILQPWLCGNDDVVATYVPGIHFTAESLSEIGKSGDHPVTGRTLWDNSAETVRLGKKAISFIPEIDVCEYDKETYAVVGLRSGHNFRQFYNEVNKKMMEWEKGEKKRLEDRKKVENDQWSLPTPPTKTPEEDKDNEETDNGTPSNWFSGFISFYLFGPTRTGTQYSALWRRSADDMTNNKDAKRAGGRAGMKEAESGRMAKEKRERAEAEAKRAKRIEEQDKLNKAQISYSVASVAQARDEFEAQRFDSEMVRISKLIDAEQGNRDFAFQRQSRYEPDTTMFNRYEDEIKEHQDKIQQYTCELRALERTRNSAGEHVDAFLGMAEEITKGSDPEVVDLNDDKDSGNQENGDGN